MNDQPAIVVVTYNRPNSLERLLKSIEGAYYITSDIVLVISIDKSDDDATNSVAENFKWNFGQKRIINRTQHLGLKQHILECGDLSNEYSSVVLLEDDLLVSPYFYQYAFEARNFYATDHHVGGISLYNYEVAESCFYPFRAVDDGSDVYFMQVASSWGQLFTKEQWSGFRNWLANNPELVNGPLIPEYIHLWGKNSWKKHYIHYLIDTDKYFVFPRLSLSTNFEEEGTNSASKNIFQVPVQLYEKKYTFQNIDKSAALYDAWFEPKPELFKNLKDYVFEVDLYGSKPLNNTDCNFVLTSKQGADPILGFSNELFPLANNVLIDLKGPEISLFRKPQPKLLPARLRQKTLLNQNEPDDFYNFSIVILADDTQPVFFDNTIRSVNSIEYTGVELLIVCTESQKKVISEKVSLLRFKYTIIPELNAAVNLSLIETGRIFCILKPGETLKKDALQRVNLIFQTFRHINWIRGVSEEFISSDRYEVLNAEKFRLVPNDILNQVQLGTLDYSLSHHFFRKSDDMDVLRDERSVFLHHIKKYQFHVVLDVFMQTVISGQQKRMDEKERNAIIKDLAQFGQKRSFRLKFLNFMVKLPFFGDKTVQKWFLFVAENYPDVIRIDKLSGIYYLNKF